MLRLTGNDRVQARVRELQQAVAEKHIVTQAEALRELKKIGFARINKAVKWGGRRVQFIDSDKLDDDTLAAIGEVSESATHLSLKPHRTVLLNDGFA